MRERERERDFHFFGEMRWWSEVQRKTVKTGIKRGIMKVEKADQKKKKSGKRTKFTYYGKHKLEHNWVIGQKAMGGVQALPFAVRFP